MNLIDHYTKELKEYHEINYQDCKNIGPHALCISVYGDVIRVKITSIKTWKRKPDIQIGLKYGLYEYATTTIYPNKPAYPITLVKEVQS